MMDIKGLSARYGVSEQAMRKYLRKNLTRLNDDGEHVKREGKTWTVDEEGVRRLDDLRGYKEPTVETVTMPRVDELSELRAENRRLMQMLLASQSKVIHLQQELLSLKETPPRTSIWELVTKLFRKSNE